MEEICEKCDGEGCELCDYDGYIFKCDYCEEKATRDTPVLDIHLCDKKECWEEFIEEECEELEE